MLHPRDMNDAPIFNFLGARLTSNHQKTRFCRAIEKLGGNKSLVDLILLPTRL